MPNTATNSVLLRTLLARTFPGHQRDHFRIGLDAMDQLAPNNGLPLGAIHELLFDATVSPPARLALLLARAAQSATDGVIIWSDPRRELCPTALATAGIDLRRLILLRPRNVTQELSALAESLRCKGVSATVTSLNRLSDIEARRLQLAAEAGGGIGVFLRPMLRNLASNSASNYISSYAAATRWLVRPSLECDDSQSWIVELLHGHGGRIGSSVLLEVDRETGDVRASAPLANRQTAAAQSRATA